MILFSCFIGLFVGLLIAFLTKEELKIGQKYFFMLEKLIFSLIVFYALFENGILLMGAILSVVLLTLLFFLKSDIHKWLYFTTGAILSFSKGVIVPVLIFFYGFPIASLFYSSEKNKNAFILIKRLFVKYWYFLLVFTAFFIVKFYV